MSVKIQIIVLIFSYIYGFIFYYLNKVNYQITTKEKIIYRSITTMLFIYNIVLIYLLILFKINNGNFHLYFFLLMIIGFINAYQMSNKLIKAKKVQDLLAKFKKKCYIKKNRG